MSLLRDLTIVLVALLALMAVITAMLIYIPYAIPPLLVLTFIGTIIFQIKQYRFEEELEKIMRDAGNEAEG